ncbi:hypothetical protein BG57_23700 [Caballeronia grimmiae]|uniref:Uncharacterized protein n=1 Tax=Caballeronia grimmiae TaxID=1071679 RepID=A0A069NPT9_9BURK|nr:hypothetical protein BG57_23700 [Caballeronia grimmiae]
MVSTASATSWVNADSSTMNLRATVDLIDELRDMVAKGEEIRLEDIDFMSRFQTHNTPRSSVTSSR